MTSTATIDNLEFTRYIQSTFKIKGGGLVIWVDPHRVGEKEVGSDKADLLLVTHPHFDHMDPQALAACATDGSVLVTNPTVLQELEGKLAAEVRSKISVVTLRAGEATEQRGVPIKAVAGYNDFHPKEQGYNTGFLFTVAGRCVFHAGDTSKVPEFGQLGAIDVALYPIGGTYTSDEEDAAGAINELIKPRVVIPMHYGYATGGDPVKFKALVASSVQAHILEPVLDVRLG